tara:strand:+ start:233 stop:601 length:369 start_codon:yes stop_codon:yes gene_type:complete
VLKVDKVAQVLLDHRVDKVLREPLVLLDQLVLRDHKEQKVPQVLKDQAEVLDQQDRQVILSQVEHLVVILLQRILLLLDQQVLITSVHQVLNLVQCMLIPLMVLQQMLNMRIWLKDTSQMSH